MCSCGLTSPSSGVWFSPESGTFGGVPVSGFSSSLSSGFSGLVGCSGIVGGLTSSSSIYPLSPLVTKSEI